VLELVLGNCVRREQNIENLWPVRPVRYFVRPVERVPYWNGT